MKDAPRLFPIASRWRGWLSHYFRGLTWKSFAAFWVIMTAYRATQMLHLFHDMGPGVVNTFTGQLQFTMQRILLAGLFWFPVFVGMIVGLNVESKTVTGRIGALVAAILVGMIAGDAVQYWLSEPLFGWGKPDIGTAWWVAQELATLPIAAIAAALLYLARRDSDALAKLRQEELDRVGLDQQMVEARLQVLQSQVEPHFLFNTLAHVRRLYDIDPPQGKSMLRHLRGYLAAALPEMRASQSTLGRELGLTVAYLNVQKVRMGARLEFDIDVPERLQSTSFPSMMLLTLVENAIKHGLGPLPEGGSIRIVARERDGGLQLQVLDDGAGFTSTSGGGVGLANTRMRLATLYGGAARLLLEQNVTRGITAMLELPIRMSADAATAT